MKVIWTDVAQAHLDAIFRDRARFSESSASALVDRLTARSWLLGEYPDLGRMVPEFNTPLIRELIEDEYRIVYERFPDRVEIIAVLPGRMSFVEWTL